MYAKENCNVRIKPIKGAEEVGNLKWAEEVKVIAKTNTEYYKLAEGKYVHQTYLSLTKPQKQEEVKVENNKGVNELGRPLTGTEDNPDPDGDGKVNIPLTYKEDNRIPTLGQFEKVGTDLQSGGHYHGEEKYIDGYWPNGTQQKNVWHYGNGNGYWMDERNFYLGRYGQHPEVPEEWYLRHMNAPVSPFQEHGDKNKDGFMWDSYRGVWAIQTKFDYTGFKGKLDHYNGVKSNLRVPQDYIQAKNYPDPSKTTLGSMWGNTYTSNDSVSWNE